MILKIPKRLIITRNSKAPNLFPKREVKGRKTKLYVDILERAPSVST